jgi:hypothetical protein
MPDATWKAVNRQICRLLGGIRSGYDGTGGRDCEGTYPYCVEVKHRKDVPQWLTDAMLQATVYAKRTELPIAVIHQERRPIKDSLVVIRLGDFIDWFVSQETR